MSEIYDENSDLGMICKLEEQVQQLQSENERLKGFARKVIKETCWNINEIDGGDVQELAEKLGLIVPKTATEDDVDDFSDFEAGDTIYQFSDILKGE